MVIVGAGRVGQALASRAAGVGADCTLLDREADWSVLDASRSPIFLAVRNDDLEAVLARIPVGHHGRLVFCQNGMLRPWLIENDLGGSTRGLLYFAVPTRGADATPGPEPSPFSGPLAGEVVAWFEQLGLPGREVPGFVMAAEEVEKLIWNCVFGLVCQRHDVTVGTAVQSHGPMVHQLVKELRVVARASIGVDLEFDPLLGRLTAYSLTIPTYKGAVKEWRWRNGWFVQEAARTGAVAPLHEDALRAIGFGDAIEQAQRVSAR